MNMGKEDIGIIQSNNSRQLTGFSLNIKWDSDYKENWL